MDTVRKPAVQSIPVGTPAAGFSDGGSDATGAGEESPSAFIELPEVVGSTNPGIVRVTHGGRTADTPPCGKCGCEFINVVCPVHWPIESVALCCAKCGSVVDYIDGLLLLTVKQAIKDRQGRSHVVRRGIGIEPPGMSGLGVAKELVQMGIGGGLTDQDIAEAMGVTEEYVSLIAHILRG